MSQHPEKNLTADDIPPAVMDAASYSVRQRVTGGHEVVMRAADGLSSVVDFKATEQAALRIAIRCQKRSNADATWRNKENT